MTQHLPTSVRICSCCHERFQVLPEDLAFYETVSPVLDGTTVSLPPPTRCPTCRLQRRLSYRAEFYYHQRSCALCRKNVVTVYPTSYQAPVYCYSCWWSDRWDPESYGRDFDFSRPFFPQYHELHRTIPHLALMNDNSVQSENCEYTYDFSYGKNCYLVTASWHTEGSLYSTQANHTREIVDSFFVVNQSELAYESLFCTGIYDCTFLAHSSGCAHCHFGYDLKGCQECFGCVGLRQKKFCFFNEQLSEQGYRAKVASLRLDTYTGQQRALRLFEEFRHKFPHRAFHQHLSEESIGDALIECKNFHGFLVNQGKDCRNAWAGERIEHCYDVSNTGLPQWCYESATPDESYQALFTIYCWKSKYLLYSENCHSSEYLLGCIGLKRRAHSILNKAYTKHNYEVTAKKILGHMRETGEWGEFFPMHFSPFYYNESRAFDLVPYTRDEALRSNLSWGETRRIVSTAVTPYPEGIDEVSDDILQSPFTCSICTRPYKIIKLELAFYRKMRLPIPRACPHCRRSARDHRYPSDGKIYSRICTSCHGETLSAFPESAHVEILCESCYVAS